MALTRTTGNESGAVKLFQYSWLLLGIAAAVFCAGCGCESDGNEASIEITKPGDGTELTYEDDEDPDRAGFQYTVSASTENIDIETAIELQIDGDSFDSPVNASTDEEGLLRFSNVTLPDGVHELKVGTPTGSVFSDPVEYTLYNLVIESPADGATLSSDSDSEVVVNVYGFDKDQKIVLTVTDEDDDPKTYKEKTSDSAEDEMVSVTFDSVTFPSGEVTLTASAEVDDDTTAESLPHTVTVVGESGPAECPAGTHEEGGVCVPDEKECPAGSHEANGVCVPDEGECPAGTHQEDGGCVRDESCAADGSSCNNHGVCDDDDGVITCSDCDEGYTGAYCDECDATADDPCGDHGQCNDNNRAAMCVCDRGYAGEDCTDCAPGFHSVSGSCVLDSQCLDTSCNGHGDCSVVNGVVTCSNCDTGYEGTFCHECDDDATDPCGDHGACDDASGTAVCDCDAGYAGDDCDECADGFNNNGTTGDPECDVSCDLADLDCGPGVCDDEDGPAVCDCEGTGLSGASCNVCADDEFENNDSDNNAWSLSSSVFFTGTGAVCSGDEDWFSLVAEVGATIEVQINFTHANGDLDLELWYEFSDPSYTRRVASGSSKTDNEDIRYVVPAGKNGLYLFRVRPVGTSFIRNSYSLFIDNRIGGTCLPNESCDPNPCQNGAGCTPDSDGDGLVQCACPSGYSGDKCESCAPGYHDDSDSCIADATCLSNTCAGQGACTEGPPPTCSCSTGYTGDNCENCADGFYRGLGGNCIVLQSCDSISCGNNGTCDNSSGPAICVCDEGYSGRNCDECAAGYHDDSGSCVADTVCISTSCDRHGSCEPGSSPNDCECDQGYGGENCETCTAGYHSSCYTCETLGVECGTWDDGCGGTITCGPCESGTSCHEYWGVCADSVCDLYDTGCCVDNTMYYCYNGGVYPYTCSGNPICGWVSNVGSKAGGYFACLPSDPGPPPDDRIQEECAPEWLPEE